MTVRGRGIIFNGCTFARNFATGSGGGILVEHGGRLGAIKSILFANCAEALGPDLAVTGTSQGTFSCSIVDSLQHYSIGSGVDYDGLTIFEDPRFRNPEACDNAPTTTGSYTLETGSPARAENNACHAQIGAPSDPCSSTSIEPLSWGQIKSRYR